MSLDFVPGGAAVGIFNWHGSEAALALATSATIADSKKYLVSTPTFTKSRFDERRGLVFGDAGILTAAQLAVPDAVKEIDQQSNREPDKETSPCFQRQAEHQGNAK